MQHIYIMVNLITGFQFNLEAAKTKFMSQIKQFGGEKEIFTLRHTLTHKGNKKCDVMSRSKT